MERQNKIVDASVIVKWFLNEEKSEEAVELINQHIEGRLTIIIPELTLLEVLNTLRFKKIQIDRLKEINKAMQDAQFTIINLDFKLLEKSIKISLDYNLTIYDAVYASLANLYDCELITEDNNLQKVPNSRSL